MQREETCMDENKKYKCDGEKKGAMNKNLQECKDYSVKLHNSRLFEYHRNCSQNVNAT